MLNGRIGQVVGPFTAGVDLLADNAPIGAFTPETTRPILYKLGVQTAEGTIIEEKHQYFQMELMQILLSTLYINKGGLV